MRLGPTVSFLLAAMLVSLVVVLPFVPDGSTAGFFRFEADVTSDAAGLAQVYWDDGRGFSEERSVRQTVEPGTKRSLVLTLPATRLTALRFDPINTHGTVALSQPRLTMQTGHTVRSFTLDQFVIGNDIASLQIEDSQLVVRTVPGALDPVLLIQPFEPLDLGSVPVGWIRHALMPAGLVLLGLMAVSAIGWAILRARGTWVRVWIEGRHSHFAERPLQSVMLVAAVAMLASSYPVVFLGKSFVSPGNGIALLYPGQPTLPGMTSMEPVDVKQADVGAVMWQHVPNSAIQHQALRSGELPLWNRYNSAGVPLLGQGQSAFGDPLHFIPLLARGASWAWDLRYLLAKWLLGCGAGYAVWLLTQSRAAALLLAASAPLVGLFVYRVNHPAIFSLSYGPWVLVVWLGTLGSTTRRALLGWAGGAVLINGALLCSGTAKEAVILLVGLNATGMLLLLCARMSWRSRLLRLVAMAWAGLVLILISAPHWMVFLDTLRQAYTSYDQPRAYQLPPGLFIGLFDEIFYRPSQRDGGVINPSANIFVLLGVLWVFVRWRAAWEDRSIRALIVAAVLPLALAFAVIPASWIVAVPGLAGVMHVDNTFSCVLIVLTFLLAGWGWKQALARLGTPEGRFETSVVFLLLLVFVGIYYGTAQAVLRSAEGYLSWGSQIRIDRWINRYVLALILATGVGFVVLHRSQASERWTAGGVLVLALCFLTLHWRHGLQVAAGNPNYVLILGERADFSARSPTIAHLQTAAAQEPARIAGLEATFFPGWSAMYRLEGISGPDALMDHHYRQLLVAGGIRQDWDWRYVLEGSTLATQQNLLDAINLRYVLAAPEQQIEPNGRYRVEFDADLRIFRSTSAWPRAFFVDRITTYTDVAELVRAIASGDGRPFAAGNASDVPAEVRRNNHPERTIIAATDYSLTVNRTSFTIDAPRSGVAVLLETYWPGAFAATLNGRPVEAFRVNHAFKAVVVPAAGTHRVEFIYRPAVLPLALGLATAGLLLALVPVLLLRRDTSLVP
jgi:hypothetical protein